MTFFRYLFLLMVMLPGGLFAQYTSTKWCFGDSAGIDFNNNLAPFVSHANGRGSCATICNNNGDLLFYSYTRDYTLWIAPSVYMFGSIRDKLNNKMLGGDTIIGTSWYHEMVIIPKSATDSTFYVFSAGESSNYGLYYSLVDLKQNNGLGQVVQKNVQLQNFSLMDNLYAIKHGNGQSWWVIFLRQDPTGLTTNNSFYLYPVDENGIGNLIVQHVGPVHNASFGQISFNKNGSKFVLISGGGMFASYYFDRCTGVITSDSVFQPEPTTAPYPFYFSGSLSPDGTKYYISHLSSGLSTDTSKLEQFDLSSPSVLASKKVIFSFPSSEVLGNLKLGPNNKLYFTNMYAGPGSSYPFNPGFYNAVNNNLSVINYPDSAGLACDLQLYSIPLGTGRTYFGLPNNPDYELGAWVGSPCDTLTTNLTPNPSPEERGAWIQAWYNHEWNMIHVNAAQLKGKKGVLRLLDIEGRIVFEKPADVVAGGYYTTEIYMQDFSEGVYIVNLVTDRETLSFKTMKY